MEPKVTEYKGYIEITGPQGCGKTTLAREIQRDFERRGFNTRIVEREQDQSRFIPRPDVLIWDSVEPPTELFRRRFIR